jgi:alkylated DNA nucleotide flippase Atl1
VPRDGKAVVQKYGADMANKNGRLPWRADEIYGKLVAAFTDLGKGTAPYAADNARYLSAILAHYVGDAHQPFHAVINYDGQATNQRGIHSRFETELVMRNKDRLTLTPVVITPIPDFRTFMFDTLIDDQPYVAQVLAADKKATEGREFYDDAYYAEFAKNGGLALAEKRFSASASGIASVWVAAWEKAGKPKLPSGDGARTPARIRK